MKTTQEFWRPGRILSCLAILCSLFLPLTAAPIDVTVAVTGTPGDWTLDFSVTNNLTGAHAVYFFGVELPARDIVGSPAGWDPDSWLTWTNTALGSSSTVYNNNWIDFSFSGPLVGQTLGGFQARVTTLTLPSAVNWFAYSFADGELYTGGGNFNTQVNPGFEGSVDLAGSPVPEPSTFLLLGAGLVGTACLRRRRSA
jgi:hypothetical protein